MARYSIKHSNGTHVCYVNSIERVGKWMGERHVIVDVTSPVLLHFEIGDYIDYSGERFTLYYDPSVLKQARSATHGEAYKYSGIKFEGCVSELSNIRFYDTTGRNENDMHFTQLSSFSFVCDTLETFAERVQANLDRWYEEQKVVKPNTKEWRVSIPATYSASRNVTIEVSKQSVWDVLENVTTKFNTTFTVREDAQYKWIMLCDDGSALLGLPAMQYGMGKGLVSIERNSDSQQKIITRLRAFGSTRNMQTHYYGEVQDPWYRIEKDKGWYQYASTANAGGYFVSIILDVLYRSENTPEVEMFFEDNPGVTYRSTSIEAFKKNDAFAKFGNCMLVHFDNISKELYDNLLKSDSVIVVKKGILKKYATRHKEWWISPFPINPNNYAIQNLMLPKFNSYRALDANDKEVWLNPSTCTLKYDNARNKLEVTGIEYEGVVYIPIYDGDDKTKVAVNYDAYIEDAELVRKYGIIEGEVYFDNENDNETGDIYPTIEGVKAEDAIAAGYDISVADDDNGYLDEFAFSAGQYYNAEKQIKDAPQDLSKAFEDFVPFGTEGYGDDGIMRVTDDSELWKGKKNQFYIFVKDLGFDPKDYFGTDAAELAITSGRCAGRSFKLIDSTLNPVQVEKDGVKYWRFWMERVTDTTLGIVYPNNNDTISGVAVDDVRPQDTAQGIKHSDRFKLINFELPKMFIDAAAVRLERAAIEYYAKHSRPIYTYVPKIDNILMKRNRDLAAVMGEASYHDVLREGLIMNFSESDFGVTNGVDTAERKFHIDSLNVKESGESLPEYTIVLKEESEFSTIAKIEKQITTITRVLGNISSGNSNVVVVNESRLSMIANGGEVSNTGGGTASINEEDVTRIGDERYAKIAEENRFEAENWFTDIHGNGFYTDAASEDIEDYGASIYDDDGLGHVQTDYINVRRAAFFRTLTIAEVEHMGGEVILSPAACRVAKVQNLAKGMVRLYFEKSANGKECYNEWKKDDQAYCQQWQDGVRTKFYWRLVTDVGEEGDYWTIELSGTDMATGSGEPDINDNVVVLGHRNGGHRASAQVYSTIGDDAPSRKYYYGITGYVLPKPIELMEHTEEGAHWKVGGDNNNYIEYDGELKIKAKSVEIVSESGNMNVGDALSDKFDIWQVDEKAPTENGVILEEAGPLAFEVSKPWVDDELAAQHVGDYLVTRDGVSYQFVERVDDIGDVYYVWEISSDRYLLQPMNFISGFRQSDAYAYLFNEVEKADGSIDVSMAGLFVKTDENGNVTSTFTVKAGKMVIETENLNLDADGNVRLRGFVYRDEIIITPDNVDDYRLDTDEWYFDMGTGALPSDAIVLDVRKTGPNFVVQGNFGTGGYANVVLPSLLPAFDINAEQLSVVRSMSGETVCITNNTELPLRIYCVNESATNGYDRGIIGGTLTKGYQRTLSCTRTFATAAGNGFAIGDEIVYWKAVGNDKKANYHKPKQ